MDNDYFQRRCHEAAANRDAFRRELGLDAGRPVILFASKLQQRKHCSDLVAAYESLINDESDRPRPYLLIVGDGEERGRARRTGQIARVVGCSFLRVS